MNMKILKSIASVTQFVVLLSILSAIQFANAQSIDAHIGSYLSSHKKELTKRPSFSFEFYFGHVLDERHKSHLGIRSYGVSYRKEKNIAYVFGTFSLAYQRLLYTKNKSQLMFDFHPGFALRGVSCKGFYYCDENCIQCDCCAFPVLTFNLQAGLSYRVPLGKPTGLQISLLYDKIFGKVHTDSPFHSAFFFEVGLTLMLKKSSMK